MHRLSAIAAPSDSGTCKRRFILAADCSYGPHERFHHLLREERNTSVQETSLNSQAAQS